MTILTVLTAFISIFGKCSSKNVSGQHRPLLSFYAMSGVFDVLAIWAQLITTLLQVPDGMYWHAIIPGVALAAYYYLNMKWNRLWSQLDPPKPESEDDLTRK
jgi:uncharacterized membrane protein